MWSAFHLTHVGRAVHCVKGILTEELFDGFYRTSDDTGALEETENIGVERVLFDGQETDARIDAVLTAFHTHQETRR